MSDNRDNFDFEYYAQCNPDVVRDHEGDEWLWRHWCQYGQYEGRRHRFWNDCYEKKYDHHDGKNDRHEDKDDDCLKPCCPYKPDDPYTPEQRAALKKAQARDAATKIQYIPSKPPSNPPCPGAPFEDQYVPKGDIQIAPGVCPWTANTMPWRKGEQSVNGGVFANGSNVSDNFYDKLDSIPSILAYYAGLDFTTIPENSARLTVFLKNFKWRGASNYVKLTYMHALTSDKMHFYAEKMDNFLNDVYSSIVTNNEPVVSTFRRELILFFLKVHVGYDDYPDFIIEYFTSFMDVIGFISNPNINLDELLLRGNQLAEPVRDWFSQRAEAVVAENDTSSIVFHWNRAGFSTETLATESLHNIIAFGQFAHVLYRTVIDAIWATNPPSEPVPFWHPPSIIPYQQLPGVGPVNFFDKIDTAPDGAQRLNVVRECYRLLTPNGNAFSNLVSDKEECKVQVRNIWASTMIFNQPTNPELPIPEDVQRLIGYFKYNPALYNADFNTSISDFDPVPEPEPVDLLNPQNEFTYSELDNNPTYNDGTVVQKVNEKVQPVFEKPIYLPFGVAYRRCPGEIFTYFMTEKILQRFKDLTFKFVEPVPNTPCDPENPDLDRYVAIAPRIAVFDNLFVDAPVTEV
jgi:hypothetical protein